MTDAFDLFDIEDIAAGPLPAAAVDGEPLDELNQWATDEVGRKATGSAVFFDIETGPRREDELAAMFREKTLDEFAADCDKRWKPDTVAAKYEEYKIRAWGEFVGRAALSPMTGRVLLIGLARGKKMDFLYDVNEEAPLIAFWELIEDFLARKIPLIGHNSNSFDLPFLVRRSWLLGVPVPREVRQGRYWNPLFRDTMEAWACGGRDYVRLNDLGAYFGIGQKTEGIKGGDFHKWWFGTMPAECGTREQQREKAIEYNGQDLRLTAAIAAKMGMV